MDVEELLSHVRLLLQTRLFFLASVLQLLLTVQTSGLVLLFVHLMQPSYLVQLRDPLPPLLL